MTSSLTNSSLGSYFLRRKHSLHDVFDCNCDGNQPDLVQRKTENVREIGISLISHVYFVTDIFDIWQWNFFFAEIDLKEFGRAIENTKASLSDTKPKTLTSHKEYQEILLFNNSVREIFMNWFVQLFSSYEQFIVQPSQVRVIFKINFCVIIFEFQIAF